MVHGAPLLTSFSAELALSPQHMRPISASANGKCRNDLETFSWKLYSLFLMGYRVLFLLTNPISSSSIYQLAHVIGQERQTEHSFP